MKKKSKPKLVRYKCPHCNGKGYTMVNWHVRKALKKYGKSAVVYKPLN